jgi:hypothetical protein
MDILTFPNFINDCDEFIELINNNKNCQNFTDSGKFTNKKWIDHQLSNKFYTKLKELTNDPRYLKANNLIMAGTYVPGDSFGLHTDTGLYYNTKDKTKSKWTLLIYLNDDFVGGETIFYNENGEYCKIKPEKGKALLFDIDLWHKGDEVIYGSKYWIGCEIIGNFI